MTQTPLGGTWYRIAETKPRLRSHVQIHRQRFRGRIWYVLQDHQSGRFFRISPAANLMLCLMDGQRTMQRIWDIAGERFGAERPTQEETVQLLVHLHQCDLSQGELPPDMTELERRATRQQQRTLLLWLKSPMAMRFPLLDPDAFLERTVAFVRPLFSIAGLLAWLALVGTGAVLAAMHWAELTNNSTDRIFSVDNLFVLLVIYPVIKLLHELGHAYATKAGGGEVHELGLMLLVFVPVPYVDASSSSAFQAPWRRALVGGAGIMVELALAAVAMIAWLHLPPGVLRAAAFNVMLIGGVSTLLFNGNPLLRFDGYYLLSDLVEIPNLDSRSKQYLLYLAQRYLLGVETARSPVQADGERRWFIAYGVASFAYRLVVMAGIALFVASRYAAVGAVLAISALAQLMVIPVFKALRYLLVSPQLRHRRRRAVAAAAGSVGLVAAILFVLPLPYATVVEGVVSVPDQSILRSGADGFVAKLLAAPGAVLAAGQPVIQIEDPVVAAQEEVRRTELAVLQNRFEAVNLIDRVQARLLADQVQRAQADLARAKQRMGDLLVVAEKPGRFVVPDALRLEGRFVHKGDLLAYVIGPVDPSIKVVVPQADIDLVRARTRAIAVRFTEHVDLDVAAWIVRETPAALTRVPAPALAPEGGGPMLLDPASPNHDRPVERFYEIELGIADANAFERIGSRVYARFDHGDEAIAWRAIRSMRQLLLRVLNV